MPDIREISQTNRPRGRKLRASKDRLAQLTRISRQKLGMTGMEIGTVQVCGTLRRGVRDGDKYHQTSGSLWQYFASVQKCMETIQSMIPVQLLCRQLLDVISMGRDWRCCPAWDEIARKLPGRTRDRMIRSNLGAAWISYHLPDLASKARLTLHRWVEPRDWMFFADDIDTWLYPANHGT